MIWWECPTCGEYNNNREAAHCLSCGESQPGHPLVSDERQAALREAVTRRYAALQKAEQLLGRADTSEALAPWAKQFEEWTATLPDAEAEYALDVYWALTLEEGILAGL